MKKPNYILYPLRPLRPLWQRRRRSPPGSSPGVIVGAPGAEPPPIRVIAYSAETCMERRLAFDGLADELVRLRGEWPALWLEVDGVDHPPTLEAIGSVFGLHRLLLEDIANEGQRAKVESYGDHIFVVLRMAMMSPELDIDQLGLVVGRDFVLTFQMRPGDPFEPVRERLRTQRNGRIRTGGSDYLAYAVLDAAIDHYFPVLEELGARLESIEEQIVKHPQRQAMTRLYAMKRDLTALRRALWPARDALNSLVRDEHAVISADTRIYLRDCYDHVVQNIDLVETFRDLATSMTDLYLSMVGQRTNEIMKVLTLITAVFVPLSFIAGVYGMNFDPDASPLNMPELRWFWGYPFALFLMFAVAAVLFVWFRSKGWIGGEEDAT